MKTWKYIELSDGYGGGHTEEGHDFIETEIQGWNDDEEFSDLVDLVSIRHVQTENESDIIITYHYEAAKNNPIVLKLLKEAKKTLKEEAEYYFSE